MVAGRRAGEKWVRWEEGQGRGRFTKDQEGGQVVRVLGGDGNEREQEGGS